MDCHDATARFSDLCDGHLGDGELAELERHLSACHTCRQEWADFERTVETLQDLGAVEPSPGFAARVRAMIEAPPWHRRLARRLFMPWHIKLPLEAAALVLLAAGAVVLYQRTPGMRQVVERPEVLQAPAPIEAKRQDAVPQEGPAPSTQPPPEPILSARPSPPASRVPLARRELSDLSSALSKHEGRPVERLESGKATQLLATPAPAPAVPTPFRTMTLRTEDVGTAEKRIREWTRQVGGRLLDAPATGEPTPSSQRTLSLIVPVQAVGRLDALLAELGQVFAKEVEAPSSSEVLVSLTISPKLFPSPPAEE
jgi:anti-sigma factor RsiW